MRRGSDDKTRSRGGGLSPPITSGLQLQESASVCIIESSGTRSHLFSNWSYADDNYPALQAL